jgi:hypothetical protein
VITSIPGVVGPSTKIANKNLEYNGRSDDDSSRRGGREIYQRVQEETEERGGMLVMGKFSSPIKVFIF